MRALACVLLLAACGDTASADLGLDALLRIPGAQYRPGPFPRPTGGPDASTITLGRPTAIRGGVDELLNAQLDLRAHAAAIGLVGADGAWIVPTGAPDTFDPNEVTLATSYAITGDVPLGPFAVQLAGVDGEGRVGDPIATDGVATDLPPTPGTLVVALEWDNDADLDLHVVDPLGGEAYFGDPNTWQPTPGNFDPDAWKAGGILDHDGNQDCRRDAAPNEHVVWTQAPPAGDYIVRVDVHDLCGAASAAYSVAAYANVTADDPGTLLAAKRGVLVPDDVSLEAHDRGAGVLALHFAR